MHKIIAASNFFVFPLHLLKTGYKIAEPCEKKYSSRTPSFAFSISLLLKEGISLWVCWSVPFHELKQINCEFEIRRGGSI